MVFTYWVDSLPENIDFIAQRNSLKITSDIFILEYKVDIIKDLFLGGI